MDQNKKKIQFTRLRISKIFVRNQNSKNVNLQGLKLKKKNFK